MTIYANKDSGSDSTGDGSSGNPYQTISKCNTEASDGDTIILQDSTASYSFGNLTLTDNITIQGEQDDGSGAIIDGGSTSNDPQWEISTDTTATIEKCRFTNFGYSNRSPAFVCSNPSKKFIFNNVWFYGFLTGTDTNKVGSLIGPSGASSGTFELHNVLMYDIGQDGGSDYFVIFAARPTEVDGLTIYLENTGTQNRVFELKGWPEGTSAGKNCIIYDNTGTFNSGAGNFDSFTYSCFYNTTDTPSGTGVITSDPLFVDAPNYDFRLRPSSPCINTGVLI